MKIGFIGIGNMAVAVASGLLREKIVNADEIIASRRNKTALELLEEQMGIVTTQDNREVVRQSDIIFLSTKPQFFQEVILEIRDLVTPEQIIISMAPGKTMEWIEMQFQKKIKLVRCMPNTPALIGEGCTGFCVNDLITKDEELLIETILSSFGIARVILENLMDAVVAVSGSAPAYIFILIEAMADGAVAAGLPRKQAYEFAAQAVKGSAMMVLETKKHPAELKDMVCSPGGTTIEAVKVLEEKGFRASILEAMEACVNKSKLL